jgi:hypothetical protein
MRYTDNLILCMFLTANNFIINVSFLRNLNNSSRAMLDLDTEPKLKDQLRKPSNMLKSLVSKVSNTKFTSKLPRRCPPTHSCSTIGSHSIVPMQQSESHFKSVSVNNRDLDPIKR